MANTTIYPRMMIYTDTTGKIYDALSGEEVGVLPPGMTPFWGYFLDKDGIEHHISELFGGGGGGGAVSSVNGKTGAVVITSDDLGLPDVLTIKGQVADQASLPATAANGDVYQTQDTKNLWAYANGGWIDLGSSTVDLTNYYTKTEIDSAHYTKTETNNLFDTHKSDSDAKYQAKLTAGTNITISSDNVISASGGGGPSEETDPVWTADKTSYYTKTEVDSLIPPVSSETDPIFTSWKDGTYSSDKANIDTEFASQDSINDSQTQAINTLTSSLNSEISARETADTSLRTSINSLSTTISGETTARQQADAALQTEIDTLSSAGYLTDAPNDGKQYARQNGSWSEVVGGSSEPQPELVEKFVYWISRMAATTNECYALARFKGDVTTKIYGRISFPNDATRYEAMTATYRVDNDWTEYTKDVELTDTEIFMEFSTDPNFSLNTIIYREHSEKPVTPLNDAPADSKIYGRKNNIWVEVPATGTLSLTKWVQKITDADGSQTTWPLTEGVAMYIQGVRAKHQDGTASIFWQDDDYTFDQTAQTITFTIAPASGDTVGLEYVGRAS